jgi:hypothetical protein
MISQAATRNERAKKRNHGCTQIYTDENKN